jgi:hypothetical protein
VKKLLEISGEPARFLPPYKTGASKRTTGRGIGRWEANPNRTSATPVALLSGRFSQFEKTGISGIPA